jgi:ferritin-like metal-binding protein YciE
VRASLELGQPEIAELCQQNLTEALDMAAWLLEQIPVVVTADVPERAADSTRRG